MASGYRISPADIEAARLVFVMLKDIRPMRKVAIPIMDDMSWASFVGQVKTKLRIRAIQSMTLASTGEPVIELAQLQDIDQVHVVEGELVPVAQELADDFQAKGIAGADRRANGASPVPQTLPNDATDDSKYVKRKGMFDSIVQRAASILPSQTSLPVTMRDSDSGGRRAKRRSRHSSNKRAYALVCGVVLLFVLSMFYIRVLRGTRSLARDTMSQSPVLRKADLSKSLEDFAQQVADGQVHAPRRPARRTVPAQQGS